VADPLAETAARLRALVPGFPDTYDVVPRAETGPGWFRIDAVPVGAWCAEAREWGNPRRLASVAAMAVGGALAHAVLARVTAALALDTRAWDLAALTVHRAPGGYLDRVAVRSTAWVVAGDPAAPEGAAEREGACGREGAAASVEGRAAGTEGRAAGAEGRAAAAEAAADAEPGSVRVFPDESALLDAVAAAAVATLAPLLRDVRDATRFGLVPLWNAAGDAVRLTAEMAPRYAGRPPRPGLAPAFLDALVAHGAPLRGRGEDQPLPGRPERVPVRAACCLAYRTDPPVARPSDALCTTCPLLPIPERARRYAAWLDGLRAPVRKADP
jgi:hypothetical protein